MEKFFVWGLGIIECYGRFVGGCVCRAWSILTFFVFLLFLIKEWYCGVADEAVDPGFL